MIKPTVEMPPIIPWTMRRTRRRGRLDTNPMRKIITAWASNPCMNRIFGLTRDAKDPQKVEARAAAKLGAPMMKPTQMRVF